MHAAHTYDSRILKVASKGVERRALREGMATPLAVERAVVHQVVVDETKGPPLPRCASARGAIRRFGVCSRRCPGTTGAREKRRWRALDPPPRARHTKDSEDPGGRWPRSPLDAPARQWRS